MMKLDVWYDFQAGMNGLDSDRYSPILQEYHRILWSKPLSNGKKFELSKTSGNRLYHKSELGEYDLSSDRAIATFSKWNRTEDIISKIPKDKLKYFKYITDTIGGIIIWPSNEIENKPTINVARGFNPMISDRLDLTIECIRRYYLNEKSPLYETLKRYKKFFNLFQDFKGYIDFFYFQDYVSSDYKSVRIALPFDNFESSPVPKTVDEYVEYMNHTVELVEARDRRIDKLGLNIDDSYSKKQLN